MSWTVFVEPVSGGFQASLVGDTAVRATGGTADEAVAGVKAVLGSRLAKGYYVTIDAADFGVAATVWPRKTREPYTPQESEMMREIVAEIYRERDADKFRGDIE